MIKKYVFILSSFLFTLNSSFSQASDLIISEYGEGYSGTSKYVEIYNGTGSSVNLSNYRLWRVQNGGSWTEGFYDFTTATLADGGTLVIANNSVDTPAADEYSNFCFWNGDDAVGLAKNIGSWTLIDAVGEDGADPGTGWTVAGISNATVDHTLTRKPTICDPNPVWFGASGSAGTNSTNSEWIVTTYGNGPANAGHTASCGSSPSVFVNPNSIAGLDYVEGFGPSSPQVFTVSGINLTANLVVTVPSDFEVALAPAGPYTASQSLTPSSGSVTDTDIYIRLKTGLVIGVYSDTVTTSSTGATDQFVNVEGEVSSTSGTCGEESFTNLNAPVGSYGNGSFTGDDGFTWTYDNARTVTSTYNITGTSIGFSDNATRRVYATSSAAGVGTVTWSVRSYFNGGDETDRTVELWVAGTLRNSFTLTAMNTVFTRSFTVNEPGAVLVELRSTGTRQIVIDDMSWTCNDAVCSGSTMSTLPTSGPFGTFVTISGNLFDANVAANNIFMGGVQIIGNYNAGSGNIEITIPSGVETAAIEITNSGGCDVSQIFTVIDDEISTCQGSLSSVPSGWTDVFISGIFDNTEGSCHYIELFNPTASVVDLDDVANDYSLAISNNRPNPNDSLVNFNQEVDISGSIQPGETIMLQLSNDLNPCADCPNITAAMIFSQVGFGVNGNNPDGFDRIILRRNATNLDMWANGEYGSPGYVYSRETTATAPNLTYTTSDWNSQGTPDCFGFELPTLYSPPTVNVPTNSSIGCDRSITLTVLATEGYNGSSPPDNQELRYFWYFLVPGSDVWQLVPNTAPYSFLAGNTDPDLTIDLTGSVDFFGYQFYCQVREDTTSCYRASGALQIALERSVFSAGAWNTLPDLTRLAIIDDTFMTGINGGANGNFSACGLVVKPTRNLTVSSSSFVRVVGDVLNNGTLLVQDHGNFVQEGDGAAAGVFINNGTTSVDKRTVTFSQIPGNTFYYTYWSSPVQIANTTTIFPNAAGNRRFYFEAANYLDDDLNDIDDNGDDWQFANSPPASDMEPGRGYAVTSSPPIGFPFSDIAFFSNTGSGGLNTGNIDITVSRNDSQMADLNFNFLGNPYASAIDFELFHAINSSILDGVAYLWSHATAESSANPGNEGLNYSAADYAVINIGSGNIAGSSGVIPTNFIPSGQGFFVQHSNSAAASPCGSVMCNTVTFTNSMRMADMTSNDQFFGIEDNLNFSANGETDFPDERNRLWINALSDNGAFIQILVAYVDGATDLDDGYYYDVKRNESNESAMLFYSLLDDSNSNKKLAIQGKDPESLTVDEIIPLGFNTVIPEPTIYTVSIARIEGSFFDSNAVYLRDNFTETIHNLTDSGYNFTSDMGEFNNRFEIIFNGDTLSLNTDEFLSGSLRVIEQENDSFQFRINPQFQMARVEIFNLFGQKVYDLNANSSSVFNSTLNHLKSGAFIARVSLTNQKVIIKKVLKQR